MPSKPNIMQVVPDTIVNVSPDHAGYPSETSKSSWNRQVTQESKEKLEKIYASTSRLMPIVTKGICAKMFVGILCTLAVCSYSLLRTKMSEDDFNLLQRSTIRATGNQHMNAVQRQLETSVSSTRALAALIHLDQGANLIDPLGSEVRKLINTTGLFAEGVRTNSSASTLDKLRARKTEAAASLIEKAHSVKFNIVAESLISTYKGISNLQLAPAGVVSIIHPLAGNRGAIGHDLFFDPSRRNGAIATIKARSVVFVGPLTLKQNGRAAIIARSPVFISSPGFVGPEPQHPSWWGFATMLVELDDLFKSATLAELRGSKISYVLYAVKGDKNIFISASPTVPGQPAKVTEDPATPWLSFAQKQGPETVAFKLEDMHVHWVMQVWPEEGWQAYSNSFVLQVALCLFFALMSFASLYGVVLRDSILHAIRYDILV